jgi:hypothetical protein
MTVERPVVISRFVFLFAVGAAAGVFACKKNQADRPAGVPASGGFSEGRPASLPPPTPPPAAAKPDDETVPAAPDPKTTISGTITVPAAHRKSLTSTDILFIIARRAGAPPGPGSMIAVQKHPLGQFPMPFTLSGRDSMLPGRPFEGRIDVSVRIDKDGDALTRKKGDLYGQINNVPVGTQDLLVSVDTVQAEDQTLSVPPPEARRPGSPPAIHP